MTRYLLILLVLTSCASSKKDQLKSYKTLPGYTEKMIPVASKDEARKVISNRTNFLKMIFEQTKDPYFGTLRWSEYCLSLNKIGLVTESPKGIQSISQLILNQNGEPGFCRDHVDHVPSRLILVYCEGMSAVIEIKLDNVIENNISSADLCE
jgi:hypothetical protein